MIEQDKFGQILAMRGRDGKDILYPHQKTGSGMTRGGASFVAPVFGSVPNTPEWEGVILPRHGIQALVTDREFQQLEVDQYGSQNHHFHFQKHDEAEASEYVYPWSFSTKISCREKTLQGSGQISTVHGLNIRRDDHCDNKRQMPVACGLYAGFKLEEGEFTLEVDGLPTLFQEERLNRPSCIPLSISSKIILKTPERTVRIRTVDFNECVVYSDNPQRYVYLAFAAGLRRKHKVLLNPGQCINPHLAIVV